MCFVEGLGFRASGFRVQVQEFRASGFRGLPVTERTYLFRVPYYGFFRISGLGLGFIGV